MRKSLTEGKLYKPNMEKNSMLGQRSLDDLIGKLKNITVVDCRTGALIEKEAFVRVDYDLTLNKDGASKYRVKTNRFGRPSYLRDNFADYICKDNPRECALKDNPNSTFIGKKLYKNKE
jgi:hypothetical protein